MKIEILNIHILGTSSHLAMVKTLDVNSLHGSVINYSQIKNLPIRNAFLKTKIFEETNTNINKDNELLFMPNDLHEMHMQDAKYEKAKYKIVLFGSLVDGRRATVVIDGIKPYFEVVIPKDTESTTDFAFLLNAELKRNQYMEPTNYEVCSGRQFKGYDKNIRTYVKFYFNKLKLRKEAIKFVREKGLNTTADDTSCYYRVVCRDHLNTFSAWANLNNYKVRTYANIKGSVFSLNISNYKPCTEDITKNIQLAKDNVMTCCWDIETFSPDGQLPIPDNLEHRMFMIGITFQWHHANDQLLRICLVDMPCDPRPNYLTIVCEDEKKLIKAFGKVVYKMKPEIFLGFNDSDYDWPWLIKRAYHYTGALTFLAQCFDSTNPWKGYDDENVMKYNFKKEHVKLEADAYADGYTLTFPGYINIDVRTIFRQLYPTAEKSNLNFYLALNKLGGKKDMPYQELFRIYGEMKSLMDARADIKTSFIKKYGLTRMLDEIYDYNPQTNNIKLKDLMAEVADYCVIDSQRCHELMKIRSVIMDRRGVAGLSYTSVFDSLYRANGMKVRNLVIARGQKRGLKFSNISNSGEMDEGKYPGAYVFPPKRGLVTSKLTIQERVDHATVVKEHVEWFEVSNNEIQEYYKIIEKYGAVLDETQIQQLQDDHVCVYILRQCFIKFLLEPSGRPITGLDFSSLYPSLIMTYNFSPEYTITDKADAQQAVKDGHTLHKIKFNFNGNVIRGWSIRHDNKLDESKADYKFGVYPAILKELFDTRNIMKKELGKWEHKKEQMEALTREEFILPDNKEAYELICFNFNYIDSKQKALKLFMNTFYGESGNKRSPFFVLQLAGAITTSGQDNIKMVQKHVETEGCDVYYGDSVTGDTPLILRERLTGIVHIKTIDGLADENEWNSYDQFKPGEPNRICKQQTTCDYEIWTEGDWHDIKRVIRHRTNKKMYRINTGTGCIDVTADHSLFTPDRVKIKPTDVEVGTELLHSFPTEFPEVNMIKTVDVFKQIHCNNCDSDQPEYEFYKNRTTETNRFCRKCVWKNNNYNDTSLVTGYFSHYEYINTMHDISIEEACIWGMFMTDSVYGYDQTHGSSKLSWFVYNSDTEYLDQALDYLEICEPRLKFKVVEDDLGSDLYKLIALGSVQLIVEKYSKLFYDNEHRLVPTQILNGSREIRQSFYNGCIGGWEDGSDENQRLIYHSKITAQCMYYLVKSLDYYVSIGAHTYVNDEYDTPTTIYSLNVSKHIIDTNDSYSLNPIAIKKITELPNVDQETFVYDIETSLGSFNGGVGSLNISNTDSIYSAMAEIHFVETDKLYFTGKQDKETYWSSLVDITFREIKLVNERVNEMLIKDNGTKFLKLAYEEALFPAAFLAKKKYYGIPHISQPNFHPKKLFIRGLEVKKRGVSGMLKKVCMSIMWDSVNLSNIYSLLKLAENKIDTIYSTDWDFSDFIMTDVYKPTKKNIKVQTFVARMVDENVPIKPYERFSYVITKKNPYKYDHRGRKANLSIGEKMELATRAEEKKMVIDLDYYMKGSVNGQLSRLITYCNMFRVEPASADLDDLKIAEDKIYKNACKYVDNYCDKYYTTYNSKGKIYQQIFRMANKVVVENLKQHYGENTIAILNSNYDIDDMEKWLEEKAEKESLKTIKGSGKQHVDKLTKDMEEKEKYKKIGELQEMYFSRKQGSIIKMREKDFRTRQLILQRKLRDNLGKIVSVLNYNTKMICDVSNKIKQALNIDNMYNDEGVEIPEFANITNSNNINQSEIDKIAQSGVQTLVENSELEDALQAMRYIYINMMSNYSYIHNTRDIVDYLKQCRNRSIGMSVTPSNFNTRSYIKNNVDSIVMEITNSKF
jgi:DNA polymerase elongation subunit (family B)